MRIRTIKPEFYLHADLYQAEVETELPLRVAFSGLWCAADREGRFKWRPMQLGAQILPYDGIEFSRVLHALTTRAFVVRYRVGDEWFGFIPSFKKHQVINNREKPSEIPDVTEAQEVDASTTREAREGHAGKAEGKGREGNKEGKEEGPKSQPKAAPTFENLIPAELDTQEFRKAWLEWIDYRRAKRKPVSAMGAAKQLDALRGWGEPKAIKALHNSIQNEWQGLFEPDEKNGTRTTDRNLGEAARIHSAASEQLAREGRRVDTLDDLP